MFLTNTFLKLANVEHLWHRILQALFVEFFLASLWGKYARAAILSPGFQKHYDSHIPLRSTNIVHAHQHHNSLPCAIKFFSNF